MKAAVLLLGVAVGALTVGMAWVDSGPGAAAGGVFVAGLARSGAATAAAAAAGAAAVPAALTSDPDPEPDPEPAAEPLPDPAPEPEPSWPAPAGSSRP